MKIRPKVKNTQRQREWAWLFHVLVAGVVSFFLASIFIYFHQAVFTSRDEAYISQVMAGYYADRPMVWVPYLSPVLTRVLNLLYRIAPGVAWYAWVQRTLIIISMVIVNICFLRWIRRTYPGKEYLPGGLIGLLTCSLLSWTLSNLSMYHTAAIVCGACACLLFTENYEGKSFWLRWLLLFALFFFALGFAPSAGVGFFCLILLIAVYRATSAIKAGSSKKQTTSRSAFLVISAGVLLVISLVLFQTEQSRLCDPRYAEWTSLRSALQQVEPVDLTEVMAVTDDAEAVENLDGDVSNVDEEMPNADEEATEVGEETLEEAADSRLEWRNLVASEYYMDSQLNAEAVDLSAADVGSGTSLLFPAAFIPAEDETTDPWTSILGLLIIIHGLLFVNAVLLFRDKRRRGELLMIVLCVVASDLFGVYFYRMKHAGFSGVFLMAIPCILVEMSALIDNVCRLLKTALAAKASEGKALKPLMLVALIVIVGIVGCRVGLGMYDNGVGGLLISDSKLDYYQDEIAKTNALYEYVSQHKQARYVYDRTMIATADAFQALQTDDLSNLYSWDAAYRYYYPYNEQLKINGLSEPLTSSDFAKEDVWLISDSEENIERLFRFLGSEYGIQTCIVAEKLEEGLQVVRFQADRYDYEGVESKESAPLRLMMYEDSSIAEYRQVTLPASEAEGDPKVTWLGPEEFMAFYHEDEQSEASPEYTRVTRGTSTVTLTYPQLGYLEPGRMFLGWKLYREENGLWFVINNEGEGIWAEQLSDGMEYNLFRNHASLNKTVPGGQTLHMFAQWKETDSFAIRYHEDDRDYLGTETSEIVYGIPTSIESHQDLGYNKIGQRFIGWKVYREDTEEWLLRSGDEESVWAKEPDGDDQYLLFGDQAIVSDIVPAGAVLHFYAQWEDTDQYTIYYHSDDYSDPDAKITQVAYLDSVRLLTIEELGFSAGKGRFLGWKAYDSDRRLWRVEDFDGLSNWSGSLPLGWTYHLYIDGAQVRKLVMPGTEVHLYAQWENEEQYTIFYYFNGNVKPSEQKTYADYRTSTPTLTVEELEFEEEGKQFTGWRVYNADTKMWRVVDPDGRESWSEKVPEGWSYRVYENGEEIIRLALPGERLRFYAQWKGTGQYTIYYHESNEADASEQVTVATYGVTIPTLTTEELGFQAEGKTFIGWRVYREDTEEWIMVDPDDGKTWSKTVPTGWRYYRYKEGGTVTKLAMPGTKIHFYAQWK